MKIPQADKTSSQSYNQSSVQLIVQDQLSCLWSRNHKENFPKLIWSNTKIPILSVFCKAGIYGKSVFQSLSFVFLRAHAWDFPFSILQFHFRLKFFHRRWYSTCSAFWLSSTFYTMSLILFFIYSIFSLLCFTVDILLWPIF